MSILKIGIISLALFKDFVNSGCSDKHRKMLNKIEGEYNAYCDENKITHEESDYFDDLFGYIGSSFTNEKTRENFMSIFLAFVNWSNAKAIEDGMKANFEFDDQQMSVDLFNPHIPDGMDITDEEYERGFFQFISVAGKKTSKLFDKVIKKYNKFLTDVDKDVADMIKLESLKSESELKKVFISDNDVVVHLGEPYIQITNGVCQLKKCVPEDYVGELGVKRFSILHFISSN